MKNVFTLVLISAMLILASCTKTIEEAKVIEPRVAEVLGLTANSGIVPFVEYDLEATTGLSCFSTWNIGFEDTTAFTQSMHSSFPGMTAPVTGRLELPESVGISAVFETKYFKFDHSMVSEQSIGFLVQPNMGSSRGYVQVKTILIDLFGDATVVKDTTYTSFTMQDAMTCNTDIGVTGFYKVRFEFHGNSGTRLRFDKIAIRGFTAIPICD